MTKIRLIPFEPAHYLELYAATLQFQTTLGLPDPGPIAARMATEGVAMSGIDEDGQLLGCAGLLIPAWGPSTGWLMLHARVLALPPATRFQAVRLTKRQLEHWMDEHDLARVEANVADGVLLFNRFIRALGFHGESVMPHYRRGQTFIKYVRFGNGLTP